MADVIESIHKITYEVDDAALQRAANAINDQLKQLSGLNTELQNLQKQLARTSEKEIEVFNKIADSINKIGTKAGQAAGKTKGIFEQFSSGAVDGLSAVKDGLDAVSFITDIATGKFGGLKAAGEVLTFTEVIEGAASLAGGIGAVISTIGLLAPLFFDTKEKIKVYWQEVDKATQVNKEVVEESKNEVTDLLKLKSTIENTATAYDTRIEAIKRLRELYPTLFQDLKDEELLTGKVADAYQKATNAIVLQAKSRVLTSRFDKEIGEVLDAKNNLEAYTTKNKSSGYIDKGLDPVSGLETYTLNRQKLGMYAISPKQLLHESNTGKLKQEQDLLTKDLAAFTTTYQNKLFVADQTLRELQEVQKTLDALLPKPKSRPTASNKIKTVKQPVLPKPETQTAESDIVSVHGLPMPDTPGLQTPHVDVKPFNPADTGSEKKGGSKLEKFLFGKETANIEDPEQKRRKEINQSIQAYQSLAQTAADAFKSIYDAQVKALDAEIEIRKQRVDAAQKLAERGNTDALKLETERLEAAQKKREEFARREQLVNSALAVSNAVLAVAQAAGETGPAALAIVPAVIAAIIAGYTAISAATRESTAQAYKDGIVNYKGKGGPRDDSNWVRISSGESIITAEGTQKNRSFLEAINKGAAFKTISPLLTNDLPMLKQPEMYANSSSYASKRELGSLEGKLDEVVNAIEDNKLKQNIFFNEQGVGIMTERAVNKNRKRWS